MSPRLSFLTLLFLLTLSFAANICYLPNGDTNKDVPCDPNAPVTQCCGTRAACLSNGLCALQATNNTDISYARGTCTDRNTPTTASAYDFRAGGVQVWQCGSQGFGRDARFCCESAAESTRCCQTETAVFTLLAASVGPSTRITTSSALVSSTRSSEIPPSQTGPSAITAGATETPIPKKKDYKGVGIGVGVGGGAALTILATVIFIFIRRRKGKGEKVSTASQYYEHRAGELESKTPHELQHTTSPVELPSQRQLAWELPADGPGNVPGQPRS
ncbi:hypothetical protein GQ44DRAFT_127413 [Phaeosphaeriaceae sp. PMI808]|nr:hypothetical protein GQ44DRAFT_127413 [Phaeosphaeriaceae sp. PMI808]